MSLQKLIWKNEQQRCRLLGRARGDLLINIVLRFRAQRQRQIARQTVRSAFDDAHTYDPRKL